MSAWIVSRDHIDVLVTALKLNRLLDPELANGAGEKLWTENYRSVNYRYGERKRRPQYSYREQAIMSPVTLYKQVKCYAYQSCEHPKWMESAARVWMDALAERIEGQLNLTPDEIRDTEEYRDAPWGV